MGCPKQREYEININEIRKMDTFSQVYKIIVAGLIVSIICAYFFQGKQDKTGLYIIVSVICCISLFYIVVFMIPKLSKDNYDHQITLYRRELGEEGDFFDLSIDETIANLSSE